MIPLLLQPVLAIDFGQIVGLIVLIISVISWIINVVQGNNPDGTPKKKKQPAEKTQTDLEKFLQEVIAGKAETGKKKPSPPPPVPGTQQRPSGEKKARKNQQKQTAAAATETTSKRQGERVADTHLKTSTLGSGVRSHLQSYMEPNRVDTAVKHDIGSHVKQDIGSDSSADRGQRKVTVHPLALALRDSNGVRQAILLNEILAKPKSLR